MIETIDVWRTILAFALTMSGGYMVFVYNGLKNNNSDFTKPVGIFSIASLIGGFTFFLEVLAKL